MVQDESGLELKPLLYYFDFDQTHDLIAWNLASYKFSAYHGMSIKYLNNLFLCNIGTDESNFFGELEQVILIERFTPWKYEWASHYSTKLYLFIQKYTGTDYYDTDKYTSRRVDRSLSFGLENMYSLSLPNYNKPSSNKYKITLPQTSEPQTAILTYLTNELIEEPVFGFYRPTKYYIKNYRKLITSPEEQIEFDFDVTNLVYCSVVVSSDSSASLIANIESQLGSCCLYKNFDNLLALIDSHIASNFPRLFNIVQTINYTITMSKSRYRGGFVFGENVSGNGSPYNYTRTINSYSYRIKPDYYYSACLLYANNDRWKNGIIYNDLGKTPVFYKNLDGSYPLPLRYCLLLPYSEDYGKFRLNKANDPNYVVHPFSPTEYVRVLAKINAPPSPIPATIEFKNTEGTFIHFGTPIFSNINVVLNTPAKISYFLSLCVRADLVPDLAGSQSLREKPSDNWLLITNNTVAGSAIETYYNHMTGGDGFLSTFDILLAGIGHPGLFKDIQGHKKIFGYCLTNYITDSYGDGSCNLRRRPGVAQNYKIACCITINGQNNYTVEDPNFTSIGQKYDDGQSEINNTCDFSDSKTINGTLFVNYFLNENQWSNSDTITIDSEPYRLKFTDQEVIDIINSLMADSPRIKEIHQWVYEIWLSLNSHKYAFLEGSEEDPRIANLGYLLERVARIMGVSVNSDGTIKAIRQKKSIERGKPLPDGWNFGQWGLNTGGHAKNSNKQTGGVTNEYRDGIIYEQRSNDIKKDNFDNVTITQGDYTLCENLPQLIDEILDDLDKALDWQDLGATAIPNADNSGKYAIFQGLAQILTEKAYMLSRISQHTSQTQVSNLIIQAVAYELLRATGQPLTPKSFEVDIGGETNAVVPYPGLSADAPTQLEQTGWILQNIAPILGSVSKIGIPETETETTEPEDTIEGETGI